LVNGMGLPKAVSFGWSDKLASAYDIRGLARLRRLSLLHCMTRAWLKRTLRNGWPKARVPCGTACGGWDWLAVNGSDNRTGDIRLVPVNALPLRAVDLSLACELFYCLDVSELIWEPPAWQKRSAPSLGVPACRSFASVRLIT
jgi:hypothetical protein